MDFIELIKGHQWTEIEARLLKLMIRWLDS